MLENIVQHAAVAGQFYEANPERLRRTLAEFAEAAEYRSPKTVQAAILPHAGYMFSGALAMKTLAAASRGHYRNAVIIAPSHRVGFDGIALPAYAGFLTPLGTAPSAREILDPLAAAGGPFRTLGEPHYIEHAVEVEIPMWQFLFGDLPVAPLITGRMDYDGIRAAAGTLRQFLTPETLWIVSSDFTHYGANFGYVPFGEPVAENLRRLDGEALRLIQAGDQLEFERFLARTGATICGGVGIELVLAALDRSPEFTSKIIGYANSGDLTGDWSHCVGYAGVIFER